jgi:hypothetical protein
MFRRTSLLISLLTLLSSGPGLFEPNSSRFETMGCINSLPHCGEIIVERRILMCNWAPNFFNMHRMYIDHDLPFPGNEDLSRYGFIKAIDCPVELVSAVNHRILSFERDWFEARFILTNNTLTYSAGSFLGCWSPTSYTRRWGNGRIAERYWSGEAFAIAMARNTGWL